MNIPGFTAEQSLREHEVNFLQRATAQPASAAGEVRPQFFRDILISASSRCCIDGNLNCCRFLGELLAASLGG
jgi:hypothetical protein